MSRAAKAITVLLVFFLAGMAFQWAISNLTISAR